MIIVSLFKPRWWHLKEKKKADSQGIMKKGSTGHCEYLTVRVEGNKKLGDVKYN